MEKQVKKEHVEGDRLEVIQAGGYKAGETDNLNTNL